MSKLLQIFETKKQEVADAMSRIPLDEVKAKAVDASPPRGFRHALELAATDLALIAEVKKASPSKGLIRPDFDPAAIARTYEAAGAHCLSVLTDAPYFQGDPSYLRLCREAVSLPVLRKDFLFHEYQVYESRAWGADAILLIVAGLDQGPLEDLYALGKSLGMDVLVEVHDDAELSRALEFKPDLVGVNNRNLKNFETDLATSERLLPRLPATTLGVSESALSSPADLDRVCKAGAQAVLIGTTFCASPDIGAKVKEVMGW